MWYTRLAYKPATHKILEQKQLRKTLPFQVEEEPNLETSPEPSPVDQPDNTAPDQPIAEIPQEITPDIPLLPDNINQDIGNSDVNSPEPPAQSINPDAGPSEIPRSPHDGCHCDRRLREIPSDLPYRRIFWDADGACPDCQAKAKAFNQRQEEFFNRLTATNV